MEVDGMMKYHKIRNVEMNVCTAEQKIAYNLAFMWHDTIKRVYNANETAGNKRACITDAVHKIIELYQQGYDYKPNKYDIDAIFCALMYGLEDYIKNDFEILTSYEQIGKMFPANYR